MSDLNSWDGRLLSWATLALLCGNASRGLKTDPRVQPPPLKN